MMFIGSVDRKFVRPAMMLIFFFIVGCAGSPPSSDTAAMAHRPPAASGRHGHPAVQKPVPGQPLSLKLRSAVHPWIGTPHRMGGQSRQGVDCSGFVRQLYKEIFDQTIPRSSTQQVRAGTPVARDQLHPGDLVFFRPPYKKNHVGIYLGDKEFAHASTSKGVMISNLGETYWRSCYWTARRYR